MNIAILERLVVGMSASIDWQCFKEGRIVVDAPKGMVWAATHTHAMCEWFENNGGQSWKRQAATDMAARVKMGLLLCEDPDCDACEET